MTKLCRECKIYDPLHKNHGDEIESNTHITCFQRIHFIFVSMKLLHLIEICGITAFNECTHSDHRRMFIDINKVGLLKDKQIEMPFPFNCTLYSKYPQNIKKYKKILQKQSIKHNITLKTDHKRFMIKSKKTTQQTGRKRIEYHQSYYNHQYA